MVLEDCELGFARPDGMRLQSPIELAKRRVQKTSVEVGKQKVLDLQIVQLIDVKSTKLITS